MDKIPWKLIKLPSKVLSQPSAMQLVIVPIKECFQIMLKYTVKTPLITIAGITFHYSAF